MMMMTMTMKTMCSSADDDEKYLNGAGAPLDKDTKARKACLLCGVMRTNKNYGLGKFV